MYQTTQKKRSQSGQLLVLVLVFGAVFLIIISSFIGSVVSQARAVDVRFEQQRATEIAEAGLNYYKWYIDFYSNNNSPNTGRVLSSGTVKTYRNARRFLKDYLNFRNIKR